MLSAGLCKWLPASSDDVLMLKIRASAKKPEIYSKLKTGWIGQLTQGARNVAVNRRRRGHIVRDLPTNQEMGQPERRGRRFNRNSNDPHQAYQAAFSTEPTIFANCCICAAGCPMLTFNSLRPAVAVSSFARSASRKPCAQPICMPERKSFLYVVRT